MTIARMPSDRDPGESALQVAIAATCRVPAGSPARRKALNRLLACMQRLPGLYRSSHQDYPEAYNRTLEWVCKNIDTFEPRGVSADESFVRWVNGYLRWRVRDLYTSDDKYIVNLKTDAIDVDPIELLPDPASKLDLVERQIAEQQAATRHRYGRKVWDYLERDPNGTLSNCHPGKHPDCHCRELVARLLLQEPPQRVRQIAREYGIPEQTLYSHWKKKCRPLVAELVRTLNSTLNLDPLP
ncbi:hypothetical protein [Rubidibacter lacunae]|nr:hypothetical protein [Rubidibacter lacunae]